MQRAVRNSCCPAMPTDDAVVLLRARTRRQTEGKSQGRVTHAGECPPRWRYGVGARRCPAAKKRTQQHALC